MDRASDTYRDYAAAAWRHWRGAPRRRIEEAALYLAHVDGALSLRAVSTASGKPLASVHRAVRRIEALRDDPLIDRALDTIGRCDVRAETSHNGGGPHDPLLGDATVRRCLDLLCGEGTFLMVADGAARAGVFSPAAGLKSPAVMIDVARASQLAARGWLRCVSRTAMSAKYVGVRRVLDRLRRGCRVPTRGHDVAPKRQPMPVLARLSRKAGVADDTILSSMCLEAARRLRADHELVEGACADTAECAVKEARRRIVAALDALGPGLADTAHAVCCRDEALSALERRMGWSARSARVVLGIALSRLADHYGVVGRSARSPAMLHCTIKDDTNGGE